MTKPLMPFCISHGRDKGLWVICGLIFWMMLLCSAGFAFSISPSTMSVPPLNPGDSFQAAFIADHELVLASAHCYSALLALSDNIISVDIPSSAPASRENCSVRIVVATDPSIGYLLPFEVEVNSALVADVHVIYDEESISLENHGNGSARVTVCQENESTSLDVSPGASLHIPAYGRVINVSNTTCATPFFSHIFEKRATIGSVKTPHAGGPLGELIKMSAFFVVAVIALGSAIYGARRLGAFLKNTH